MIEEIDFSITEVTDENSLDFEEIAADESDLKFDIEFIDEINTDSISYLMLLQNWKSLILDWAKKTMLN